jgi:rhodanese-related sulfurtransferase
MSPRTTVSPEAVARYRRCAIVDIRPLDERRGAIGFIPGSVRLDPGDGGRWIDVLARSYARETFVVFACTSGRRSIDAANLARRQGWARSRSLDGGVLAWRARGLPACGVEVAPSVAPLATDEAFVRALTSCFVAEATETQLDSNVYGAAFDPRAFITRILAEQPKPTTRGTLERAIEQIAEFARQHGHGLSSIAANVDRMLAGLEAHP